MITARLVYACDHWINTGFSAAISPADLHRHRREAHAQPCPVCRCRAERPDLVDSLIAELTDGPGRFAHPAPPPSEGP